MRVTATTASPYKNIPSNKPRRAPGPKYEYIYPDSLDAMCGQWSLRSRAIPTGYLGTKLMVWEKFMVFPLSDEFRLSNRIRPFCEGKLFPEEMRRRLRHPLYPVCIFREDLTMRSETLRSLDGVHLAFLAHGDDAKLFANLPDLYPMTITRWSTGWVMPHCPHCGEYVDYLERYNPLTGIATCENSQCRQSTTQLESWRRFFRTEEVSKASLLCVIDQDACEEMYEFYKAIKKKEVCKLTQWTVMMAHSMPKKATILEQRGIAHLV